MYNKILLNRIGDRVDPILGGARLDSFQGGAVLDRSAI